jgi:hypothetical protein
MSGPGPDKFEIGGSACCEAMTEAMRHRQVVFMTAQVSVAGWQIVTPHPEREKPDEYTVLPISNCPFCASRLFKTPCAYRAWNQNGLRCGFPAAMPISTYCPAHTVANVEFRNRQEGENLRMLDKLNEGEAISGNVTERKH